MQALLRLFAEIALHRRGPQDVPASPAILALTLALYVALGVAALAPSASGPAEVLGEVGVDLALVVFGFGGLLVVLGRRHRLQQTLAALFGTGALLTALSLPFLWLAAAPAPGDEPTTAVLFSSIVLLTLLCASLLVTGHVLRCALDWPYAGGVLAAALYFAASVLIFGWLFPQGGA